jgi:(S)-mandelate dehydrogenase
MNFLADHYLARAYCIEDLRRIARRRLPRAVFDVFDGGSEQELTLRDNVAAFSRIRLLPKILSGAAKVDLQTDIVGSRAELPIVIAPTGHAGVGWRGADLAIARAARKFGIPYTLATSATPSIEEMAAQAGGRLWFQSYMFKQREFTHRLIQRAQEAGYECLVVTVDLPVGGRRLRDLRNDFADPFRFTMRNLVDFASSPAWAMSMLVRGKPVLGNLKDFVPSGDIVAVTSTVGRNYDPAFDWDGLKGIRDAWKGRMLVKGVIRGDDVEPLVRMGCDGVVVSNHGGRQLDGCIATIDALPGVVSAAGGRLAVLLDGGIRHGADVFKALASGAQAVLIGRATLYGAFAGGDAGALRALSILEEELRRTMHLCGARRISEVTPDLLAGRAMAS